MKKLFNYFTIFEIILYLGSLVLITVPFFVVGGNNYINLIASVIGATSLILCAKGNPVGVAIMIAENVTNTLKGIEQQNVIMVYFVCHKKILLFNRAKL